MILSFHKLKSLPVVLTKAAEALDKFLTEDNGLSHAPCDCFIHSEGTNFIRVVAWNADKMKHERKPWHRIQAIRAAMPLGVTVTMFDANIMQIEVEEVKKESAPTEAGALQPKAKKRETSKNPNS